MTEVAYGNPETMSATQDMSSHERLEGMVSPGPSPCSDASFGGTVQNPVKNVLAPMAEIEDRSSGKLIPESNSLSGESSAGHGKDKLSAEKIKVLYGADDFNTTLGIPYQYLRDIKDRSTDESLLDAPESEFVENLPALEESAVQISALETTTVKPSALESSSVATSAIDNLIVDTPVIRSTDETHAMDMSTVEIRAMELFITADVKEETAFVGECSHFQDLVRDVVPDVIRMGVGAEDVILKDKYVDEVVGVEQQPLPGPFKNEGQGVTSKSIPVMESPLIGIVDACQITLDELGVVQNGETRMDEDVPATNYALSLSTTDVSRVENEADNTKEDTTGRTVKVTAEKLTEDTDDKPVGEMSDRMLNKLSNGMADRMADAIAEEIADEIADRMADEIADKMADEMADEMVDGIADIITDRTAHELADEMADEMTDRMADEMADRMADRMADEMADRMADEMAAEVADELAAEVGEADHGRGEGHQNDERLDGENLEVGGVGEVEMGEDAIGVMEDDGYEDDDGSPAEQMSFVQELERFFKRRNLEYKAPKFYGLELNVLKLWRVVSRYGGYDHVTVSKLWRTVGEEFKPPKTCTTISWSFRGFYEKALLDYERLKTGLSAPDNCQRTVQTIGCYLTNDQRTASPATPSSDPNIGGTPRSGSGRARRDAASRAMQGWHFQRMGNGDARETSSKDKGSGGKHVKKEKKLTNLGGNGLKRKGTKTILERAVKAVQARGRPRLHEESPPSNSAVTGKRSMKQQDSGRRPMKIAKVDGPVGDFDPPIVDEGPKADWVKINVHKHLDCFEIYALVPGLAREEVRIQCEPGGRLVIAGMPEDPENPWGVTPFRKVICLPSRIDAHQTSAVVTLYGQLYVRVPIADDKSS